MEPIFKKLRKSNHLPQVPQIMVRLVRACNHDTADTDELTRIISTDPGLSAKLLQIISSPYVNLPEEVTTIKAAVVFLGLDTLRNIAISSSAMHFFKLSRALPEFDMTRFWHHSYKCGVIARRMAQEEGRSDPEEYFLAGLLHDIGRLVLMQNFPKAYQEVLAAAQNGTSISSAEFSRFRTDSSQVSAWLFSQWQLNPMTSDAVLFMNQPLERIRGELAHVKILYMANQLAGSDPAMADILSLTRISEARLDHILAQARDEVAQMARQLGMGLNKRKDRTAERDVAMEIRDLSLFYGTLESLTQARDRSQVLDILEKGVDILFGVDRVFFFVLDQERQILSGYCNPRDRHHKIVRSIALPLKTSSASLVAKALETGTAQASHGRERLAASDSQIIRLLASPGFHAVPIMARHNGIAVMALATDQRKSAAITQSQGLVRLFSRQAGICLENLAFHTSYARDVNERKMEAYAALTDRVVHEINNPVAIVRSYLESLKLKLPEKHPAQEDLVVAGEEIARISSLLEGLSSFSNPRIGSHAYMDINQTVTRILAVLKKSILLPAGITTTLRCDPQLPPVKTDVNGFKQILINLVKNAAEAMEKGGRIEIATSLLPGSARVLIDEKLRIPGAVEIRIQDNGPGIPAHIREHLFEPYNSGKSGYHKGIGLSIVHAIVKELNGRITCESREGLGTCFTVFLPVGRERTRITAKGERRHA